MRIRENQEAIFAPEFVAAAFRRGLWFYPPENHRL
jgi:hypothetical protein